MANRERRKGLDGEAEVAALLRRYGYAVRGLEGTGDFLALGAPSVLHVEVKRQEVARPWLWHEQALTEAPPDTLPLVAFRRSRSRWLALAELEPLASIMLGGARRHGGSDAA